MTSKNRKTVLPQYRNINQLAIVTGMKTIEIERKVKLAPQHVAKIAHEGTLVSSKTIVDSYYDTDKYALTLQDMWLRQRDGIFELKVGPGTKRLVDRYEEITEERIILSRLGLPNTMDVPSAIAQNGIESFCTFTTYRTSYRIGKLRIDIDDADFGDLSYQLAEIEIIVGHESEIQEAEKQIEAFVKHLGVESSQILAGKVTYYLYHRRPEHYQALLRNGIIAPIAPDTGSQNIRNF